MSNPRHYIPVLVTILAILFSSCGKEEKNTSISIEFTHSVGNKAFLKDSLQYINAAGNRY